MKTYSTGVPVQIRVYENRIRFYNDGCLPEGWTVKKLMKEHKSDPHNPLIAGAFFRTGDIEAWGRGIDTIRDACREHGSDFPTFESEPTSMMVEFKEVVPDKTEPEITPKTRVETQGERLAEGLVERLVEGLVESQRKILVLISQNPSVSKQEMADKIGISTTAVDKNIAYLRKKGLIKRIGAARGGHWEVLEEHP